MIQPEGCLTNEPEGLLSNNERAQAAIDLLDERLAVFEEALVERADRYMMGAELIAQAKKGDQRGLPRDFWLDDRWAYDYAAALGQGRHIRLWLNDGLVSPPEGEAVFRDQRLSAYEVAKLLYQIDPSNNTQLRVAIGCLPRLLPDVQNFQYDFSGVDRSEKLMTAFLESEGLFEEGRTSVVRLADYSDKGKLLINSLGAHGLGAVTTDYHPGQMTFKPTGWLQKWMHLYAGTVSESGIIPLGPMLRSDDQQLMYSVALRIAPMLEEASSHSDMQIVVGNHSDYTMATILRGLNVIRRNNIHQVYSVPAFLGIPKGYTFPAFRIGHMLKHELESYVLAAARYHSFGNFEAARYAEINYEPMRPQDTEIKRVALEAEDAVMGQLGIDPAKPDTLLKDFEAAHICIGSNMYPVMMRERLSSGAILGVDIAPAAKSYVEQLRDGYHRVMWTQHEQDIKQSAWKLGKDPAAFEGSFQRAIDKLHIVIDDAGKLPERSFRLVEMHFGAEATGETRSNFYNMLRAIEGSLKDDGIFEAIFTINSSDAWPDGKNELPATVLDERDYDLALIDSGFDIVDKVPIGTDLPDEQKLRPGEDFIYYRCRLRRNTSQ